MDICPFFPEKVLGGLLGCLCQLAFHRFGILVNAVSVDDFALPVTVFNQVGHNDHKTFVSEDLHRLPNRWSFSNPISKPSPVGVSNAF